MARPVEPFANFFPRNSQHSMNVAPSTYSWVSTTQDNGSKKNPLPPPRPHYMQPAGIPSRPLPNPHPLQRQLQLVNHDVDEPVAAAASRKKSRMNEYQVAPGTNHNRPYEPTDFDILNRPTSQTNPLTIRKKKTLMGGLVKGIRRLPKAVFGSGSRDQLYSDVSRQHVSSNLTLPPYSSKPSSPIVGLGPSGMNIQYTQPMVLGDRRTREQSPPPDVVRLDDLKPPISRVSQYEDSGPLYDDGEHVQNTDIVQHHNANEDYQHHTPADRTTVMLYGNDEHEPEQPHTGDMHPPPGVSRPLTNSPGLSYTSSEAPSPAPAATRPLSSLHDELPHLQIPLSQSQPPPVSLPPARARPPRRVPTPGPGQRLSHASQLTMIREHSPPQSLIPGAFPGSSPLAQEVVLEHQQAPVTTVNDASAVQPPPSNVPMPIPHPHPPTIATPPPEAARSPESLHAELAEDYRRMNSSPGMSSGYYTAAGTTSVTTSSYEPSFSSQQLNSVEKFFKLLYNMPWISHDRVTVDYKPGDGMGEMKKRKPKPASSWYKTMISRSSASLDLLSSGTPSSRGSMSIAMVFGSQFAGSERSKQYSSEARGGGSSRHHKSSRHRRQRRHRHHGHHGSGHRSKRRETATTLDTTTTARTDKRGLPPMKPMASPMIPSPYPFQFPPYPFTTFSAFPMSLPAPAPAGTGDNAHAQGGSASESPRGSKGEPQQAQQQPPVIYPAPGYNPYQPLMQMTPPQMYILHPTSTNPPLQTTQFGGASGHDLGNNNNANQGLTQAQQTQQQAARAQNTAGSFTQR